jgi:hypothetical protein
MPARKPGEKLDSSLILLTTAYLPQTPKKCQMDEKYVVLNGNYQAK